MSRIRQRELHARRIRSRKLKKLRKMYKNAKSSSEKTKILEKLGRIAPSLTKDDFDKS